MPERGCPHRRATPSTRKESRAGSFALYNRFLGQIRNRFLVFALLRCRAILRGAFLGTASLTLDANGLLCDEASKFRNQNRRRPTTNGESGFNRPNLQVWLLSPGPGQRNPIRPMTRLRTRHLFTAAMGAGLVAALLLAQPQPAMAQASPAPGLSESDQARVAALVDQAKLDFSAGMVHDALRNFRDAWALAKTPEIAANLAIVEAGFEHHRDAAEHFQFSLSHLSAGATPEQRRAVEKGLEAEKHHVLTLDVRGVAGSVTISIDGQPSGRASGINELYVEPGRHNLHAEASGYESSGIVVDGAAGDTVAVQFDMRPVAGTLEGPKNEPLKTDVMDRAANGPSTVPLIVGGSVAVVGVAVGTIFVLKANSASNDASDARSGLIGDSACSAGTTFASQCASLHAALNSQQHDQNIAVVSFSVAGAAAIGTALYWFWPRSSSAAVPRTNASVAPGYVALHANWSW